MALKFFKGAFKDKNENLFLAKKKKSIPITSPKLFLAHEVLKALKTLMWLLASTYKTFIKTNSLFQIHNLQKFPIGINGFLSKKNFKANAKPQDPVQKNLKKFRFDTLPKKKLFHI